MSAWSPEELRRAAIEALGEYADPRARDALQQGQLTIAPGVAGWEGSEGRVEAHRVILALDAEQLGRLRASHAVVDALDAALAKAVARRKGEVLLGVELRWARRGDRAVSRGYRDGPPVGEGTLRDALIAYLDGAGKPTLARIVAQGEVATEPTRVRVVLPAELRAQLGDHEHAIPTLTSALRDLLASPGISVNVES
jgi:hypothetical protein